jgi:hypothetical protein
MWKRPWSESSAAQLHAGSAAVEISVSDLDELFFAKKLPPLVLTSKPLPVKDIWGFYDYKKNGVLGSTVVHFLVCCL